MRCTYCPKGAVNGLHSHWPTCDDEACNEEASHDMYVTETGRREIRGLE